MRSRSDTCFYNPHSALHFVVYLVVRKRLKYLPITSESLDLIEESFRDVAKKMDFQILEFNGEGDHVHALIEYPPKLSISQMVNSLKGVSSRQYGRAGFPKPDNNSALWSPSYFVSSVGGAPLEVLKKYIQNQLKPS